MSEFRTRAASGSRRPRLVEPIEDARAALTRERRILREEVAAFEAFQRRVRAVDAESTASATSEATAAGDAPVARGGPSFARSDDRIREAYASTVMDVPHYDDEYGDTVWESIAGEFGASTAAALRQSAVVTSFAKRRVLAAADDAVATRERMLSVLDEEETALDEAAGNLRAVREDLVAIRSRPFYDCPDRELRQLRGDLQHLQTRCETLAVRRQSGDIAFETARIRGSPVHSVNDYLYQSTPSTYPVLSALATATDCIETTLATIRELLDSPRTP